MPAGNKRGPDGEGPMTGRKMGYCTGNDQPGYTNSPGGYGRGAGRRRGAGTGFRWSFRRPYDDGTEKVSGESWFKNEVRHLGEQLENVLKHLREMKKSN